MIYFLIKAKSIFNGEGDTKKHVLSFFRLVFD